MSPLTDFTQVLSEWALALGGAIGSGILALGGVVGGNYRRSKQNERRLEGDPDDPNNEGVLQIAKDTRDDLRDFREDMKAEHRELREIVEEAIDDGDGRSRPADD